MEYVNRIALSHLKIPTHGFATRILPLFVVVWFFSTLMRSIIFFNWVNRAKKKALHPYHSFKVHAQLVISASAAIDAFLQMCTISIANRLTDYLFDVLLLISSDVNMCVLISSNI